MANLAGFVAPLVLAALPAAAPPLPRSASAPAPAPAPNKDLLHEELALRWLGAQGFDPTNARQAGIEGVVEQRFTRLAWGALDLRLPPAALAESAATQDTAGALAALLDAQTELLKWLAGPKQDRAVENDTEDAVETLKKWLKRWKPRDFADPDRFLGRDLLEVLEVDEEVRAAAAAFRTYLLQGGPLAREPELRPARMILYPSRGELIEFACAVGYLRPEIRELFWVDGLETWTMFDFDGTRVVGMQFAGPRAERDYTDAIPMDARNKDALNEHVVQLGVRSLLETFSAGRIEPALAAGLANDLVISLYGEVDTRSDGDLRSRQTHGRSVFIPGANPNGGTLPAVNADSRFRADRGKGHFVRILKSVQKQGGKRGKTDGEKLARFRLMTDDQTDKLLVHAPFLGPSAQAPPPAEFLADYAELLRAYRAAFLYWVRTEAASSELEARKSFAELMRKATDPRERRDLAQLFEDVYGRALSAPTPDGLFEAKTLEGEFLEWLSRS